MRIIVIPVVLLMTGCTANKTWQQSCFKSATPAKQGLFAPAPAPVYDPVLNVRQDSPRTLVYCQE